ncbi:response regulator transcription factor [Parasediminibacterium paludis]|uniref:Response regulator transcription factor n=1 Tax=Parasediminibacterium paludis TaxID=908966 RepID=A0ABV8PUZ8_9BACT
MPIKKIDILIVDDSITILTRMKEILSEIKCVNIIDIATNSNDALELLLFRQPALILLDINMPHKNGIELLKEVKLLYPKVKVMMVTNQSVDYYKPICMEFGAEYFIDKSTEFELIPDIIESISKSVTGK